MENLDGNMIRIYNGQPILELENGISAGKPTTFGMYRDRMPDRDWVKYVRLI